MSEVAAVAAPPRHTYIGSSDIAAIEGVSKWRTPVQVWASKVDPKQGVDEEWRQPDRARILRRGHKLEPYIVDMMAEALRDRGHDVEIVARGDRHAHPEFGFLQAEIDAELIVDGVACNAEAKSSGRYADLSAWGEPGTDEIPIPYLAQVHYAQACTRRARTWVGALFGLDDVDLYCVDADVPMQDAIIGDAARFWEHNVMLRVPPPPKVRDDLELIYRSSKPAPKMATPEIIEAARGLFNARARAKRLEREAAMLELQIGAFMGDAELLIDDNAEKILYWRQIPGEDIDVKAFRRDHQDWAALYARQRTARPMRFHKAFKG